MTRLGAGVRPATAEERAGQPPTALDIRRAAQRIAGRVRRTPVLPLGPGERIAQPVWLKLECLQLTGSFKVRNAFAFLLATEVPEAGVMAVSGGNFGLAMAYAARALGHRITVFVPELAPKVKIDGIRALGAAVEVVSGPMSAIFSASEERIARTGALFVHPYDQHEIMAGAGTCGLEFDEQRPGLDTVLVAVGGGGLIGGIAAWFGDRVRVVAVETEGTPTLHAALAAGKRVAVEPSGVAASSLGGPMIGALAWALAERSIHDSLLVTDEHVRAAQHDLWETARLVVEPGGAAAYAALLAGVYLPAANERVGVVLCGANTDPGSVTARL
jgi:threonine dehydratase